MLHHLVKSFRNQLVLSTIETLLKRPRLATALPAADGVEIVHNLPGRVRLRSATILNQKPIAESLQETLNMVEGITVAVVDWRTGSVLIHYENNHLHSSQLKAAVERLLEDEQETANGISSGGIIARQRPLRESILDLVSAHPLLFGSLALILMTSLIADTRKANDAAYQSHE